MFDAHAEVRSLDHPEECGDRDPASRPSVRGAEAWNRMPFAEVVALARLELPAELRTIEASFPVRRVRAGETLHRAGDPFDAFYVVRSGFFKTVSVDDSGAEVVLAFPMGGDLIGIDAINAGRWLVQVVALDVSSVVVVPYRHLAQLGREHPGVERLMYAAFSRELASKHSLCWLLGALSAEGRLASFLLDMSERFGCLGFARNDFTLRATRQEIGGHLGLKLETVSRTLSAFAAAGLIAIDRREVRLLDPVGLRRIMGGQAHAVAAQPARTGAAARRPATHGMQGVATLALAA